MSDLDVASATCGDLLELRHQINIELQQRAFEQLKGAVALYIDALGSSPSAGCEQACDDFFRHIAQSAYPGGWAALLGYAMKAAG